MSAEENKALVRRWIEEGWSDGNVTTLVELSAPDIIWHHRNGEIVRGIDDFQKVATAVISNNPRSQHRIEDMIATGEMVMTRFRIDNWKDGTLLALGLQRLANGKIVESWWHGDEAESEVQK